LQSRIESTRVSTPCGQIHAGVLERTLCDGIVVRAASAINKHGKEDNSRKLVRGEIERHNGAITCREVGRLIIELTTGANLNLTKSSAKIFATRNTPRTQLLASGQLAWTEFGELVLVGVVPPMFGGTPVGAEPAGTVPPPPPPELGGPAEEGGIVASLKLSSIDCVDSEVGA
jgi:hypothetical protein